MNAKKCAGCGLPITVASVGEAVAAERHHHHVVVALCTRCASIARRLPRGAHTRELIRNARAVLYFGPRNPPSIRKCRAH